MGKRRKIFPVKAAVITVIVIALGYGAWRLWWPEDAMARLQQHSRQLPTLALADSAQKPPTNKWFSSLAFKQPSDPVFAYPLALQTTGTGVDISYPAVSAGADTIDASFRRDLGLTFGASSKSYVSSYDDLSVELEVRANDQKQAAIRITQGSPYLFVHLASGAHMTIDAAAYSQADGGAWRFQNNGRTYELSLGTSATYDPATHAVTASANNALAALYVTPDDAQSSVLRAAAQNAITGTEVSYKVDGTSTTTTFVVHTQNGQPTVFGLLPDQTNGHAAQDGHFTTLLGTQTLQAGTSFTFKTALPNMPANLPVTSLPAAQQDQLKDLVRQDAGKLTFDATDTYYAGKQLYRAANLLQLAHQLGLNSEAANIQHALKTELTQWFDPNTGNQRNNKYFYYDTTIKGIVGVTPSFGSEDFNDHHFHYGYMLYAAAVLGQYDDVFVAQYGPAVTLLARDIADPNRNDAPLPYLRMFDQYAGHSWASGFAPFGSGNNQESSSEAVNAWYGMYRWAQVSGNNALGTEAQWLFARETSAALRDYLNIDQTRPELAGYNHNIVSLLWGGKADYATFFDAAPESKLAIQLLPFNPAAGYLGSDKSHVQLNLAAVGPNPSKFKDYVAMYQVFTDPKGALAAAATLGDTDLDGANSRSYLYAWLLTHQ